MNLNYYNQVLLTSYADTARQEPLALVAMLGISEELAKKIGSLQGVHTLLLLDFSFPLFMPAGVSKHDGVNYFEDVVDALLAMDRERLREIGSNLFLT